jgi:hypothetical protein
VSKTLWLTYAWANNKQGDFDYLVQELDKSSLLVKFDRRALIPGQRLWDQIGSNIIDPAKCSAWGILLTADSLASQPCMEELSYALDRALSVKGEGFPVFALLHQISPAQMPPALKVRLGIPLENNPNWVEQVVAAVEQRPLGLLIAAQSPWVLKWHQQQDGEVLEIRPRFDRISPFAVVVDLADKQSGNAFDCMIGPADMIPKGQGAFGWINSESTLTDGTKVWVWGGNNEATSATAYYLFCKKRPKRIWIGHQQHLTPVTNP